MPIGAAAGSGGSGGSGGAGSVTISLPDWITIDTGLAGGGMEAGTVVAFAGATAPEGWLLCNGAAVNRDTYAVLFAAIGTTYGVGNGNTTFNLPDLRGRFALGVDNMGGQSANRVTVSEADRLNGRGGTEKHTLTVAELPAHTHGTNARERAPTDGNSAFRTSRSGGGSVVDTLTTLSTGDGQAHNNMPPWLALNYLIKT